MDGTVLGFDTASGTGVIKGSDDKRYSFETAEWKSDRQAKSGDAVDFVAEGDVAREIYVTKAAGSAAASALTGLGAKLGDKATRAEALKAVSSSEAATIFLTKPHVVGAALIILGWLVAGHLFIFNFVNDLGQGMRDIGRFTDGGIGLFRFLGTWVWLAMYLIPVWAGWLIFRAWNDQETGKNKNQAAFAGLAMPILVPLVSFIFILLGLPGEIRSMILDGARAAGRSGMSLFDLIDIDFGWMLMILGGALIVLQRMGIVKSFKGS